jgi:hypothetical protein
MQLSVATLENNFGDQLWGATYEQLLVRTTALGSSFEKQLWENVFGSNFWGKL